MLIAARSTTWLTPDWPAPHTVKAVVATRAGQLAEPPYNGFNTAAHVGAAAASVARCRRFFQQQFHLCQTPQWLDQIHGTDVVNAQDDALVRRADACYSREIGQACTLHTADCLPVFFCDRQAQQVALAHAGWRGLAAGILENTVRTFNCSPADILCWIGPAIQQNDFEVGAEVKACFEASGQTIPKAAFVKSARTTNGQPHYYCDLIALATARLQQQGVTAISGGKLSTYSDTRFFSFRRQPECGRILSAIWLA